MARRADYLGVLKAAITIAHHCHSTHRETFLVRETIGNDETLWEGRVELFRLQGHKKAENCFVWQHIDAGGRTKIFSVLESEAVVSAQVAVRATIARNIQPVRPHCRKLLRERSRESQQSQRLAREAQINAEDLETVFRALG